MVLSNSSKCSMFQGRFSFRENGLSFKFIPIRSYDQLTLGEQLFTCILRNDEAEISRLFRDHKDRTVLEKLLQLVAENQFARLVLDRLFSNDALQYLPQDLREKLTVLAMQETAFQKKVGKRFAELLGALSALKRHHLWIKGVSLSRTAYDDINHRHYGDLDLVVHREKIVETFEVFKDLGFVAHLSPGLCNQFGVGPVTAVTDFLLSPHPELVQASALCLYKADYPMIDLKFAPLDRGVQMLDFERCFEEAETLTCGSESFYAPNLVDHLLISVHNLEKDRSLRWKNLYDVHMLASKIGDDAVLWYEFVKRCQRESVEFSAWFALSLALDRFNSPVPDVVLAKLRPNQPLWIQQLTLAISPFFVWNATSLPMMLANALVSSDSDRKFKIVVASMFPSKDFLSAYYNENRQISGVKFFPILVWHWLVLLLPGGSVRLLMGHLWATPKSPSSVTHCQKSALLEIG